MEAFCKSAWLGLNSYQESDSPRFFGRNEESDRLVEAIGENGLCTVFGPSGAGKTSLLLAGVFPRLRRSDFFPVYLRFDHEKGAARYVRQVVDALDGAVQKAGFAIRETAPSVLPAADETLWEWFHRHLFLDDCLNPIRPVLMIDQFEEIFTKGLERRGAEEVQAFFTELTDLCTNNIPQTVVRTVEDGRGKLEFDHENCNWRLVVSLREDFLPRLEEVSHDHPVFSKMRQSVSSLTRDQALQAVRGPGGELVDETVSTAIVDVVGRSASGRSGRVEPALLSLFCSRLDIARQQKGLSRITSELLAASGKDILAGFYAEMMGQVSERTAELIEDHLLTAGGYRDSWAEEDAKHAGVLQSEIDTLVDARLLHIDYRGGVCWLEFSHDILTSVARANRDGRRQRRETEVLQAKLRRQRAHTRRVTGLLVALVALLAVSTVAVWHFFYREYAPCYLRTVEVFGRVQGIGEPLSESDKQQASLYFRLRKHGRYSFYPHAGFGHWFEESPVYRMEAIDWEGKLTTQHNMVTYLWNGEEIVAEEDGKASAFATDSKTGAKVVGSRIQSSAELKKVCAWEFDYGSDGRPLHEFGVDRDGNRVWDCTYASCSDENQWRQRTVVHFVYMRGFPVRQSTNNAEYVEVTYDEKTGFARRFVYYDASGRISKGKDGAECQEQDSNSRGLCTRLASMAWSEADRRFTNILDLVGNTGLDVEYLSNDMVVVSRSFGLNNEPHPIASGILTYRREYDRFNNLLSQQSFGTNGLECADGNGVSRIRQIYRKNGALERNDFYAPPDCGGVWGYTNVHHVICRYDERGEIANQSFYGVKGEPVIGANNAHQTCWHRETVAGQGRVAVEWYLDVGTNGVAEGNGVARNETVYDSNDTMTRVDLYALDGCGGVWGYTNVHHVVRLYDAKGNETNLCFYGVGDVPVAGRDNAHRTCRKYEMIAGESREVAEWYLDENDGEVPDANGIARMETSYDANGTKIKREFFAPKGKCGIWDYEKVHRVVYFYDALGNVIDGLCYGINNQREDVGNKVHRICRRYDTIADKSLVVAERYLDVQNNEVASENGVARIEKTYDSHGVKIHDNLYAPKGCGGIWNYEKVHHVIRLYDADVNVVEESFWDVDGKPTAGNNRAAKTCMKYAKFGTEFKRTEERYYDGEGNETADENGVARNRTEYDQSGRMTRVDLYAPKGRGGIWNYEKVHHVIRLYDARGNETNQSFYGVGEEPVAGNNNAHRTCWRFETIAGKSLEVVQWYLDEDGRAVDNANGVMRQETAYDANGNMTMVRFCDAQGNLVLVNGLFAACAWTYDERNEKVGETYYDEKMEQVRIVSIAYAGEIVGGSHAAAVGVKEGDIFCEFGTYRLRDDGDFSAVESSIREFAQREKRLVVARKSGDGNRILAFDLPAGVMGIRICHRQMTDREFEKIQEAYREYLDKGK